MALEIVSRAEWQAKPPKSVKYMNKTVSYVIIHHSETPPVCSTSEECIKAMQSIQKFHQTARGWADIGYRYATRNALLSWSSNWLQSYY